MVKTATKGLARAAEIYENRDQRIREVKDEGKQVFGYFCVYPVLEMMTAFDIVPYRILGDLEEPITEAGAYLTELACPFVRTTLDLALKGKYDFLDGVTFGHSCDFDCHLYTVWKPVIKTPNAFFLDTPHHTHQPAQELMKLHLKDFQEHLESVTGKKLTKTMLKKAINLHNQQRALVHSLYDLRKSDPPLISGTEMVQVIKSVMSLPIEEGNQLVKDVINEVKTRKTGGPEKKTGRLIVWGPVIDNTAYLGLIESLDANVVMDDTCVGTRAFYPDVPLTADPLDGLNQHYLVDLKCPRTEREAIPGSAKLDHMLDLEARYGYLREFVKDWNVNGAILMAPLFCDIHAFDVPDVKDYFQSLGVPSIYIEHDYSRASLGGMRTRVEGFLEVIAQNKK